MKFKVGDIVITKTCTLHDHGSGPKGPKGVECTIRRVDKFDEYGLCYETDIPCTLPGFSPAYAYWWGCEGCFDLKAPPAKEPVGEWELCPWQPSVEHKSFPRDGRDKR